MVSIRQPKNHSIRCTFPLHLVAIFQITVLCSVNHKPVCQASATDPHRNSMQFGSSSRDLWRYLIGTPGEKIEPLRNWVVNFYNSTQLERSFCGLTSSAGILSQYYHRRTDWGHGTTDFFIRSVPVKILDSRKCLARSGELIHPLLERHGFDRKRIALLTFACGYTIDDGRTVD